MGQLAPPPTTYIFLMHEELPSHWVGFPPKVKVPWSSQREVRTSGL